MLLHCLGKRAEDDSHLRQLRLERRRDGDAVEHRIDGHSAQSLLFFERDSEFVESLPHLGVDFIQRVQFLFLFRRGVVADRLVVDFVVMDVGPRRLFHREPMPQSFESPFEQPFRLVLFRRDQADDVFVEAGWRDIGFDIRDKTVFVFLICELFDRAAHNQFIPSGARDLRWRSEIRDFVQGVSTLPFHRRRLAMLGVNSMLYS